MEKKLNLNDLFGILFPGAVLCASIYAFLIKIAWAQTAQLDWSATLAMLPIAYVVGLVIREVGNFLFHEREMATRLMHARDLTFSADFKQGVKAAFVDVFKLPAEGDELSGR